MARKISKQLMRGIVLPFALTLISTISFGQQMASRTNSLAYPNPTKDKIRIETKRPLSELQGILVTNTNGKIVHGYTIEQGPNQLEVNLDKQPVGNYYVHLIYQEADERIQVSKY